MAENIKSVYKKANATVCHRLSNFLFPSVTLYPYFCFIRSEEGRFVNLSVLDYQICEAA